MTDLTLPAERASRDRLADRTDVLDKVKALRALPGDTYVTTDMVATYFEIERNAVEQIVSRNRDEIIEDGYRVIRRSEVTDTLSVTPADIGLPPTAGSLALFPRRAVLRIGMLLRDSEIARAVRTELLNLEHAAPAPAFDIKSIDDIRALVEAASSAVAMVGLERAGREVAEAKVAELAPAASAWTRMVEQKGTVDVKTAATLLCQAGIIMGQNRLFALMRERNWINTKRRPYQPIVERGYLSEVPTGDVWRDEDGIDHIKVKTCFTPKGLQRIRDVLQSEKEAAAAGESA